MTNHRLFRTLLVVAVVFCSAALAQSTAPTPVTRSAAPDLQTLAQQIFSPMADAQPVIVLCSPPTNDVCANKNCQCVRFTCSRCGVKSFTCDEATGHSTCVCKTC
jgi:hypothetical protein